MEAILPQLVLILGYLIHLKTQQHIIGKEQIQLLYSKQLQELVLLLLIDMEQVTKQNFNLEQVLTMIQEVEVMVPILMNGIWVLLMVVPEFKILK